MVGLSLAIFAISGSQILNGHLASSGWLVKCNLRNSGEGQRIV